MPARRRQLSGITDFLPVQRPTWLPKYIPELQGLRGIAVLLVFFYHCHPRLKDTWASGASAWGWTGVNLFFVLSGFLITSILLETRSGPHYFRNFYARRALRIWPVYGLAIAACYLLAWFFNRQDAVPVKTAPWLAYIFLVQNLIHRAIPGDIGPTWSLAIEEQYYFAWAPAVRLLTRPWALAAVLFAALAASPAMRAANFAWLTPVDTLTHLDGIAMGSLLALGLHTLALSRRAWLLTGLAGTASGLCAAATIARGTIFLDSALAVGFGGAVLAAAASSGAHNPLSAALRRGPLEFYGRISYSLYMIHIMVFIYCGSFDLRMDRYGVAGDWAVVALRLAAATAAATALWYGFEAPILRLKRYFRSSTPQSGSPV